MFNDVYRWQTHSEALLLTGVREIKQSVFCKEPNSQARLLIILAFRDLVEKKSHLWSLFWVEKKSHLWSPLCKPSIVWVRSQLLHEEAKLASLQIRLVSERKLPWHQKKAYRELQSKIFHLWESYRNNERTANQLLRACAHFYGPVEDWRLNQNPVGRALSARYSTLQVLHQNGSFRSHHI